MSATIRAVSLASLACVGLASAGCSSSTTTAPAGATAPTADPTAPASPGAPVAEPASDSAAPFAVVELFTSEGCSSCPPQERVIHDVSQAALGDRVVFAEWHVDYWDSLGWKDPFSSKGATDRQDLYDKGSLFTPQTLVNGVDCAKCSTTTLKTTVESALAKAETVRTTLWVSSKAGETPLVVEYRVEDAPKDTMIVVALVQPGLSSVVTRGENAGQTLTHTSVVRSFASKPSGRGQVSLDVPSGVDLKASSLLGFVQDPKSLAIVGATKARITSP